MLVGLPIRPNLPRGLSTNPNLEEVTQYVRDLSHALDIYVAQATSAPVGMIGVRGFSTTGITSQNFVKSLNIGTATQVRWTFDRIEPDASYLLFWSPTISTGLVVMGVSAATTNVLLMLGAPAPSSCLLSLMLAR